MTILAMTTVRRASLAGALIALVLGALVGPVGPASAHDELISTQPASGAVLDAPPATIGLEFSEDVLAISPTVVLTGPDGDVPLESPVVTGTQVSVAVPLGLAPGAYSVIWRVVSADGHPVQGTFAFSLTAPVATPTPTPTPTPTGATTTGETVTTPAAEAATSTSPTGQSAGGTSGLSGPATGVIVGLLVLATAIATTLSRRRRR